MVSFKPPRLWAFVAAAELTKTAASSDGSLLLEIPPQKQQPTQNHLGLRPWEPDLPTDAFLCLLACCVPWSRGTSSLAVPVTNLTLTTVGLFLVGVRG